MKKSVVNPITKFVSSVAFIVSLVLFCMNPVSCKMSEEGIDVLEASNSPIIQSFEVTTSSSASVVFTKEVNVITATVFFADSKDSIGVSFDGMLRDNFYYVNFEFAEDLQLGKSYELYGEVEDNHGNSLTFNLPFLGFNNNVPELEITEIHPKYVKASNNYKCEYVEIYVNSSGNLSGLELVSGYDGEDKKYSFPTIEVCKGEYLIVHLRSKGDGCISELGSELDLSFAKYSCDSARDLWDSNEEARLGDDNDVVILRNSSNGIILDAVLYSTSESLNWKKDYQKDLAILAFEGNKWSPSSEITSAIKIDGITASKSIVKNNKENCASSWSVTNSSGETPGF